jgi:hypothetical protein
MSESRRSFMTGWQRAGLAGLASALVLLLSGDRGRTATSSGIDPLEILKLQVRPNVFVVLDSSGSMGETPASNSVGGDSPYSKLYQAKAVMKQIILDNQEKVSFQFGKYTQPLPSPANPPTQTLTTFTLPTGNSSRFLYISTDPNADAMQVNPGGSVGSTGRVRRNTSSMDFTEGGVTYYRLQAGRFLNARRIYVLANGTFCSDVASGTATDPPFVEMQVKNACADASGTGPVVRFDWAGADTWNGAFASNTCGGYQSLVDMASCTNITQIDDIGTYLEPELEIDVNTGQITGYSETGVGCSVTNPCRPNEFGIRGAGNTPIANSLINFKTLFDSLWNTGTANVPAISTQTPVKQKTFAIVVTDGDDTCDTTTTSGSGDNLALRAAYRGQVLYNRIVPTDPASGVTTFVVAFGTGVAPARANWIAWGGSGMVKGTTGTGAATRWASTPTPAERSACTTCQDAFIAATASDLSDAIQSVIDQSVGQGQFSAAQSIVGTVFELTVDDPTTTTVVESAFDPTTRYNQRVNILYQSTFELPGWKGHLGAFRNDGTFQSAPGANSLGIWEAGRTLHDAVLTPMQTLDLGHGANHFTFAELHGGADVRTISASAAVIKRRIFTSNGNGSFPRDGTNDSQFDSALAAGSNVVALWPPNQTGLTSGIGNIDPGVGIVGSLDAALGITTMTFAELQSEFGACEASTDAGYGPPPAGCDFVGNPTLATDTAKKEARQVLLADLAGAEIADGSDGLVVRDASTSEMFFQARGWILGDTTLAAPAIVTPPLKFPPSQHTAEFILYRDGRRDANAQGINEIDKGFGLRNPDGDDPSPQGNTALKPVMTVVYLGANDMLHAFRAGPECATGGCEQGSEELWGFLPFDQLGKLVELHNGQTSTPHIYVVASSIRAADIFVPDSDGYNLSGQDFTGRWRTVLFFGRGPGGKNYTAIDVTVPGPFTRKALDTNPPWVMWSRGNPDTVDGTPAGALVNAADTLAYSKMGETWSVPAIGNVDPSLGLEWRAFTGSGYSDTPGEGSTFYALDALTGNVIQSYDLPGGLTDYITDNALVAGPSAFNPRAQDPPNTAMPDPIDRVTRVYIPDVQGRIWKYTVASADLFYDAGPTQPIANPVSLLKFDSKPHVFAEAGNDSRVDPVVTGVPFKMFGLRDEDADEFTFSLGTLLFTLDFPATPPSNIFYRGTVQPATAFNANNQPRVFFAGTRFNPAGASTCFSSFDTILFAVSGRTGGAVYDFDNDGVADLYAEFEQNKTTGIQVTGGGLSLGESGSLGALPSPTPNPNPTPTPGAPNPAYIITNALRTGSPVCRTP